MVRESDMENYIVCRWHKHVKCTAARQQLKKRSRWPSITPLTITVHVQDVDGIHSCQHVAMSYSTHNRKQEKKESQNFQEFGVKLKLVMAWQNKTNAAGASLSLSLMSHWTINHFDSNQNNKKTPGKVSKRQTLQIKSKTMNN